MIPDNPYFWRFPDTADSNPATAAGADSGGVSQDGLWLDKTIQEDIGDTKNLVLDVRGVEYISSAGLRVLLGAQKKMQKIGSMKVKNVCAEVMDVLQMTGFADILVIE